MCRRDRQKCNKYENTSTDVRKQAGANIQKQTTAEESRILKIVSVKLYRLTDKDLENSKCQRINTSQNQRPGFNKKIQ